jgi:hypothetical protein
MTRLTRNARPPQLRTNFILLFARPYPIGSFVSNIGRFLIGRETLATGGTKLAPLNVVVTLINGDPLWPKQTPNE